MKSIDIRSESAVKLLSEFLDMDAPYVEGDRHVNAEHFAHGMFILPIILSNCIIEVKTSITRNLLLFEIAL